MFFSSKPKAKLDLILDIQSSIVRGALVLKRPNDIPEVIYIYSTFIPFKPQVSSGYLVKMTLRAVEETIQAILKELSLRKTAQHIELPQHISAAHYVLSSPWIVSQAKTISLSFPKETKVTKEKIRSITEEERLKLLGDEANSLSVIEEKVFDVRLNGYSIPSWQGRLAKELEISFVVGVAGTRMIESLRNACLHIVPSGRIDFHSSLFLQNIGIQRVLPDRSTYTIIHVHGELTDVVVMKNHSCVFFGSYPWGVQSVIRKIAHASKTDEQAAESLFTLSLGNNLDASHAASSRKIVDDIADGWVSEYAHMMKLSGLKVLPDDIIISARAHEDFFVNTFKNKYPDADVITLEIDQIIPTVRFAPSVEKLRILGLCINAIHSSVHE